MLSDIEDVVGSVKYHVPSGHTCTEVKDTK